MHFFKQLNIEDISGVAYKNMTLKKDIIRYFDSKERASIAECGEAFNLSTPKITSIINELIEDGVVTESGKVESTGGRRASIYGLVPDSCFFLGVEVKYNSINIAIMDFKKQLVKDIERTNFKLENSQDSLNNLIEAIKEYMKNPPVPKEKILGIGINLSGRINFSTGYSYSFFHFQEDPLSRVIENEIGIQTFIENDSRAMAYGEFYSGAVTSEKNVIFINLDYGIGLGILVNGQMYYGKSGFSGEFGHIPFFQNEILCHCGKKGCLETEASGTALVQLCKTKLAAGSSSILSKKVPDINAIKLEDIIAASKEDDTLAIEIIGEIGEKLGKGMATLINLFNPELLIIGGTLASTGDYIRLPIKSALNKYSLSMVNNDTQLKISKLGEHAGVIGACLHVRNKIFSIN